MYFIFQHTPDFRKWIVLAPHRSDRPDIKKGTETFCPFCPGNEEKEEELYRIPCTKNPSSSRPSEARGGISHTPSGLLKEIPRLSANWRIARNDKKAQDDSSPWAIRVIPNKFPFAPIHEVIIHSPDHHKNIDELPTEYVARLFVVYRQRYQTHQGEGHVCIFHNCGTQAGESVPHPHSQLAVLPSSVPFDAQPLLPENEQEGVRTSFFHIFAPKVVSWPDEVWIAPLDTGRRFGEITNKEIEDLAVCLPRLIRLMSLRHGYEFPFNYIIYPGSNWYVRLVPRQKTLGGFELGTNIYVNTQDPKETDIFLQTHFHQPEPFVVLSRHKAHYRKHV